MFTFSLLRSSAKQAPIGFGFFMDTVYSMTYSLLMIDDD